MSILPKYAETVPSALMAMKEASSFGTSGGFAPCACAALTARTVSNPTGMPIETTNAPPALSSARRENIGGLVHFCHVRLPQPIIVAARLTARMMFMWVPQRHFSPSSACLISASLGFFLLLRNAAAVMIQPLMQ